MLCVCDIKGVRRLALLLFALLALSPLVARADCGGQTYSILPSSISARVLRHTIGIVQFYSLRDDSTGNLNIHSRPGGKITGTLTPERVMPVGIMPTCRRPNVLEGFQFPVVAESAGYLRIIPDVRKDRSIWISVAESTQVYRGYWLDRFALLGKDTGIDIFFGVQKVKVYDRPSTRSRFHMMQGPKPALWPATAYKMLKQVGDFIEIGDGGWEGAPLKSLGWIRIRANGRLVIWTSYYDDC